jgi:hypothetical protein
MASEMRRVARSLVESRSESFASHYPRAESEARVANALAGFAPRRMRFEAAWKEQPGSLQLEVAFRPARGIDLFLKSMSVVLTLLLASAAWALVSAEEGRALRFLVPMAAVLAILAFPFVVAALGSQREAEESRMRRLIERALADMELS